MSDESQADLTRRRALQFLLLILAVGCLFRFYRLDQQSVWGDEFCGTVGAINNPSLSSFLVWCIQWSTAPFYPFCAYFWNKIPHPDTLLWYRAFSLMFGLATIPMGYLLAATLRNRRAGLVAALCVAASPMFVWNAQSIRPYPMLILLGAVSMYAGLQIIARRNWRWWALFILVNAMGFWCHWLYAVFIATQFLCLFVLSPGNRVSTVLWGAVQGIPMSYGIWIVLTTPPLNSEWREQPDFIQGWKGVFGEAIQSYTPETPSWLLNMNMPQAHTLAILGPEVIFALLVAWMLFAAIRDLYRNRYAEPGTVGTAHAAQWLFLAAPVFLVPGILLTLQFLSGMPFLLDRYVLHLSIVRCVALGVFLGYARTRFVRYLVPTAILICLVYQLALLLPATTRTNWYGLAEYLGDRHKSGDIVLADYTSSRNFQLHVPRSRFVCHTAFDGEVALDIAVWALNLPATSPERSVWFVHRCNYDMESTDEFEQDITNLGLRYEHTVFLGMEHLILFKIMKNGAETAASAPLEMRVDPQEETTALRDHMISLGYSATDVNLYLNRMVRGSINLIIHPAAILAFNLLQTGDCRFAEDTARFFLQQSDLPELHFALGLALLEKGDTTQARESLDRAYRTGHRVVMSMKPFAEAIYRHEYRLALQIGEEADQGGLHWGSIFREIARRMENPALPKLPFGVIPVRDEDFEPLAACFTLIPDREALSPGALLRVADTLALMGKFDASLRLLAGPMSDTTGEERRQTRIREVEQAGQQERCLK